MQYDHHTEWPTIHPASVEPFERLIGPERYERLRHRLSTAARALGGKRVIHVNSTRSGGGVAEMLHRILPYLQGSGVDNRWYVIEADEAFFSTTKTLHRLLHGWPSSGEDQLAFMAGHYESVMESNAEWLRNLIEPGDVVVLHDPQTIGLAGRLRERGASVVWQCHVGTDRHNRESKAAWSFFAPYLADIDVFVLSRAAYAPPELEHRRLVVMPPSIDPFSPKNEELTPEATTAILTHIGIVAPDHADPAAVPGFIRSDGSIARVYRAAEIVNSGQPIPEDAPVILQVSRWDSLKDMPGVMNGFRTIDAARFDAHLVLAGPQVHGVTDDPEGSQILRECIEMWRDLPEETRRRVHLVSLPMIDLDENAAMVNSLQRHAAVIAQKSLAEGFGLTVTEALWKGRPVVASAVGGIVDQIDHGVHGLLLSDPTDTRTLGHHLESLLSSPEIADTMALRGRRRVLARFLDNRQLEQHAQLITQLASSRIVH